MAWLRDLLSPTNIWSILGVLFPAGTTAVSGWASKLAGFSLSINLCLALVTGACTIIVVDYFHGWFDRRNTHLKRIADLEEFLRPKIKVTRLTETVMVANFERTVSIEILNDSTEALPDCLAKITGLILRRINGVSGETEDISELYAKHLPIAVRTAASTMGNRLGPFRLRAGEKKSIMLFARVDATGNHAELRFNYEPGNLPFVYQVPSFLDGEIEVTILGPPTPTIERLGVSVNDRGELVVVRNNG